MRAFAPPEGSEKTTGKRLVVQAEDFTGEDKGTVRKTAAKVAVQGEAFLNWNNPGHWLEWPINVAASGVYTISFRYCTQDEGAERAIVLDGAYPAECCRAVSFPSTGGYSNERDDWRSLPLLDPATRRPVPVYLSAGNHTLRVYNLNRPVNLDYITFEPLIGD